MSPLLPMYKSHSLMPSDAPQVEAAEVEEEEVQRPLQDHLKRHKDSMFPHHRVT